MIMIINLRACLQLNLATLPRWYSLIKHKEFYIFFVFLIYLFFNLSLFFFHFQLIYYFVLYLLFISKFLFSVVYFSPLIGYILIWKLISCINSLILWHLIRMDVVNLLKRFLKEKQEGEEIEIDQDWDGWIVWKKIWMV